MRRPPLFLILVISSVMPFALAVVVPALGVIADSLAAPFAIVQFLVTGSVLGMGLMQFFIGPLADRFGRRPVLLVGLSVFIAGSLLCAAAGSIGLLIAARFLQSLGAAASSVVAYSIARDAFDDDGVPRILAYVTAAMELAVIAAAPIGGHLALKFGWQSLFIVTGGIALVILVAAAISLPETRPANAARKFSFGTLIGNYRLLIGEEKFSGNIIILSVISGAGIIIYTVAPSIFGRTLHIGAGQIGNLLMLNGVAHVAGALLIARLASQIRANILMAVLLAFSLTACLMFLALPLRFGITLWMVLVTLLTLSAARAGIFALGFSAAIGAVPELTGTASGLASSVNSILTAFFGASGVGIYERSVLPTAIVMAGCIFLGLLTYAVISVRASARHQVVPCAIVK